VLAGSGRKYVFGRPDETPGARTGIQIAGLVSTITAASANKPRENKGLCYGELVNDERGLFSVVSPANPVAVSVDEAAMRVGASIVPAAMMSIVAANLSPSISGRRASEAAVAKIASLAVKFGALPVILYLPTRFALDLQSLGGLWILHTLPPMIKPAAATRGQPASRCRDNRSDCDDAAVVRGFLASLSKMPLSKAVRMVGESFGASCSGAWGLTARQSSAMVPLATEYIFVSVPRPLAAMRRARKAS
jgi:hypothetical protein